MTLVPAGGPTWTDILTGIGTVGAVIVALGIALYTDWRAARRINAEHERSDRVLAEERERSRAALEDERAYGRAQLEGERRLARERQQLAGAYAVQVVNAQNFQMFGDATLEEVVSGSLANTFAVQVDWTHLAVLIVNRGSYTITRVEVRFSPDGHSLVPATRGVRLLGFAELPEHLGNTILSRGLTRRRPTFLRRGTPVSVSGPTPLVRTASGTRIRWCAGPTSGGRAGNTSSAWSGRSRMARRGSRSHPH
jgi:hypothetical protein